MIREGFWEYKKSQWRNVVTKEGFLRLEEMPNHKLNVWLNFFLFFFTADFSFPVWIKCKEVFRLKRLNPNSGSIQHKASTENNISVKFKYSERP